MRFAYTQHNSAIDKTVFAWIDAASAQGNEPCLLLDGSMFKPQTIEKWQRQSIDLKPALAGTDFDSYGLQGPLLWRLETGDSPQLRTLLHKADGIPGLSLIVPRRGEEALRKTLLWLAVAHMEDEQKMHCRFADTRMLPALLDSLKPEQRAILSAAIAEWAWIARDATLHQKTFHAEDVAKPEDEPDPFSVDVAQFSCLMNRAEPDMLFQIVADEIPDMLPDGPPHVTHERLVRLLDAAHGHGITDLPDLFQYAVAGFLTRDDFDRHPAIQDTWQQIRNEGKRFGELIKQWPDDMWETLRQPNHSPLTP